MHRRPLLLACCVLAACGGDGTTRASNTDTISGTYTLRGVNGAPLPDALSTNSSIVDDILDNAITLDSARGTWMQNMHRRSVVSGTR